MPISVFLMWRFSAAEASQMLFFPSWKFCRNAWPAVGSRSKYRLCMRVDFPDPLSPTMPSTSPG